MVRYAFSVLLFAAFLLGVIPSLRGDDRDDRDRRARAALAFAVVKPKDSAAPAPRAVEPRTYPDGFVKAGRDEKPLVVFVGCKGHPVDGAIVSTVSAESFGETKAPAVVVGMAVGDRFQVEATLKCPVDKAELARCVSETAKKIPNPAPGHGAVAPKPLQWKIGTKPEGCSCGGDCKCSPGSCPGKCPVAQPAVQPVAQPAAEPTPPRMVLKRYFNYDRRGRRYEWQQWEYEAPAAPPEPQPQVFVPSQFYASNGTICVSGSR
jgi:hypothetical protein